MFRALDSPNYRLIWAGSLLSNIGFWMQKVAQSWLVLELSDSAFLLGLDAFAADAPLLAFALLGGILADRLDRRLLLMWTQVASVGTALILAALTFAGVVEVWHVIALSFLTGCIQAISVPTYLSFVPSLVPRQQLSSAIALNSIQFNISRMIGPALAGALLAGPGAAGCFLANACSYLAVVVGLKRMKKTEVPADTRVPVGRSFRQGAAFVMRRRIIFKLLVVVFSLSFLAAPVVTFLPLFARDVLGSGPRGYSLLLALFGVGAVAGALSVATVPDVRGKVGRVLAAAAGLALTILAFAWSRSLLLSSAMALLGGAAVIACNAQLNTMVQSESPRRLRGRIMSMYGLAFRGGMPLGNLLAGALAQSYGGPIALTVNGIGILLFVGCVYLSGMFREK